MGLFSVCDEHYAFCMMCVEECRQKVSAPEIFDFLKGMGVTPESIGSYVEAFKKWFELSVQLTPLNVVYLAESNRLVSLPLYDPRLACFVVGVEIKGTCFFEHFEKRKTAPLMSLKQAHDALEKRTLDLLKINGASSPRILTFPTTADLENWSAADPYVSQTLHVLSRKVLSNMRCSEGTYWIDPTLKQSLAEVCAKLRCNVVGTYKPQSSETYCRAMGVVHLDLKYDFSGRFTKFGELTNETVQELMRLRELS